MRMSRFLLKNLLILCDKKIKIYKIKKIRETRKRHTKNSSCHLKVNMKK